MRNKAKERLEEFYKEETIKALKGESPNPHEQEILDVLNSVGAQDEDKEEVRAVWGNESVPTEAEVYEEKIMHAWRQH